MGRLVVGAVIGFCVWLTASSALAASVTYTDRATFAAALGVSITDPYDPALYGPHVTIHDNAEMSAVLGETDYTSTGFSGLAILSGSDLAYCAGCNGSFRLGFTTTSIGTASGVYGVGFDYWNDPTFQNGDPYHAYVTFADGTHTSVALETVLLRTRLQFFGITDTRLIRSLHVGRSDGGIDTRGNVGIDNLTIGQAPVPVPEPSSLLLVGAGALGIARSLARRRRVSA